MLIPQANPGGGTPVRKRAAAVVLAGAAGFMMMGAPVAMADNPHPVDRVANTPKVGGQLNSAWGEVASNLAQLDTTAEGGTGGAMGQHSRSTKAADNNGGFASSDNALGITLSDNTDGSTGREGVGNVSADDEGPHGVNPGDGGNGQHALNNARLAGVLNPVNGELTTTVGGTAPDVSSELLEGTQ
ncbi:hypothetical protein ACI784_13650 [Geodermatophilus sp. SYSU D01186]